MNGVLRARLSARRQFGWPVAWAALIFYLSSRPVLPTPPIPIADKIAHLGAYGLLGTLLCRLGHGWRAAVLAWFIAAAYGATDEWHQAYVPGRSTEIADWLADAIGAALAVTLYTRWAAYRNLLERPIGRKRTEPGSGEISNSKNQDPRESPGSSSQA
jgi:VanZ family protein